MLSCIFIINYFNFKQNLGNIPVYYFNLYAIMNQRRHYYPNISAWVIIRQMRQTSEEIDVCRICQNHLNFEFSYLSYCGNMI